MIDSTASEETFHQDGELSTSPVVTLPNLLVLTFALLGAAPIGPRHAEVAQAPAEAFVAPPPEPAVKPAPANDDHIRSH